MKKLTLLIFACLSWHHCSFAAPVGFGATPWTQVPHHKESVKGLRLNTGWVANTRMYGIDLGIAASSYDHFVGSALSLVGNTTGGKGAIVTGAQIGGLFNWNSRTSTIVGVQYGGIINFNEGDSNLYGVQGAFINTGKNHVHGVQLGIYNKAEVVNGLQIGLLNRTKELNGIQIGLGNISKKGGLPFSPIINIGF